MKSNTFHLRGFWSTACRSLFYRTLKTRPPTPNLSRQYVMSTGIFEFGPLLAGRQLGGSVQSLAKRYPDHAAKIRITNCGLFPLHADFWLKSQGEALASSMAPPPQPSESTVAKSSKGLKQALVSSFSSAPVAAQFAVHPTSMDLTVDEVQELMVLALPKMEGPAEDVIVCR